MRKIIDVTILEEGRDKGKLFRLTEMSASRAEEWAAKALLAVTKAGVDIGDVKGSGMAGIAAMGLRSITGLSFFDLKPLMDEMFECITRIPNASTLNISRPLVEDDTEEVATRLKLRAEVFALHTGFSLTDLASKPSSVTPPAA